MAAACLALLAFMYTVPADSHTLPIGPFKTGNPVSTGNTAQDSYTVPANGALQVYAWNACRNVTNTNTSNLFVPTKTHQEWQAFISNPPTGVTVPNCTLPSHDHCRHPVSWTGTCGAMCVDRVEDGITHDIRTATISSGTSQGTATFACRAGGRWVKTSGTCTRYCTARQPYYWTGTGANSRMSCHANLQETACGVTRTVSDTTRPEIGTGVFTCRQGNMWDKDPRTDCTRPSNCVDLSGKKYSWTVAATVNSNPRTCTSDANVPTHALTPTTQLPPISDTTAPVTGSVTLRCVGNQWQEMSKTCYRECDANPAFDFDGCTTSLPKTAHGAPPATYRDTTWNGSVTVQCSDGIWHVNSRRCPKPKCPTVSGRSSRTWSESGHICSSIRYTALPQSVDGTTITVQGRGGGCKAGNAVYRCDIGTPSNPTVAWTKISSTCGRSCGGSLSWTADGNTCTKTVDRCAYAASIEHARGPISVLSAVTRQTDGTHAQGSATYSCNNGTLTGPTAPISCPTVSDCPAVSSRKGTSPNRNTWGSCWGPLPTKKHGSDASVRNRRDGYTGNATFDCNDGNWKIRPGSMSCRRIPKRRCSGRVTWNTNCGDTLPSTASGSTVTAANDAAGYSGSARFTCTNGIWSAPLSGATCTAQTCDATTRVTWTVEDSDCYGGPRSQGTYGAANVTVNNTKPLFVGRAEYSCDAGGTAGSTRGSSGVWSNAKNSTCEPFARGCSIKKQTWGSGSCTGQVSATSSGSSGTATDSTTSSTDHCVGSATYTCTNGNWGPTPTRQSCLCSCVVPSGGTERGWSQGSVRCAGNIPAGTYSSGSTSTITDTGGSDGTTGSATFECNNRLWRENTGSVCRAPENLCGGTASGTTADCTGAGGTPVSVGTCKICKFSNATPAAGTIYAAIGCDPNFDVRQSGDATCRRYSFAPVNKTCPSNWYPYYNYSTTFPTYADRRSGCNDSQSEKSGSHSFSNTTTELVSDTDYYVGLFNRPSTCSSTAYRYEIGCVKGSAWGQSCSKRTVRWDNNCTGSASAADDNQTMSVSTSELDGDWCGGYTGNATFRCVNGTWRQEGSSTCTGSSAWFCGGE